MNRPVIVCLCGSTRFQQAFADANCQETMAGRIVLSVGVFVHGQDVSITPEQKVMLDELHKRKIDLADEVLVINVGGYVGESTRGEIEYAKRRGKTVRFLEPVAKPVCDGGGCGFPCSRCGAEFGGRCGVPDCDGKRRCVCGGGE